MTVFFLCSNELKDFALEWCAIPPSIQSILVACIFLVVFLALFNIKLESAVNFSRSVGKYGEEDSRHSSKGMLKWMHYQLAVFKLWDPSERKKNWLSQIMHDYWCQDRGNSPLKAFKVKLSWAVMVPNISRPRSLVHFVPNLNKLSLEI